MRQKEKRLVAALLAVALCLAAVPQAFAEQGTYEWGDEAADSSMEDAAPSAPADSSADHGVIAYSVENYGLSTYSDTGWAVALDADTAAATEHEATTYSEGGFNVYTAESVTNNTYTGTDYTVTIPAEVEIDTEKNRGSFDIKTELQNCCNLAVEIAPTNNNKQFTVENGRLTGTLTSGEGATLPYRISDYKLVFWKTETNETKTTDTYTVNLRVPETTIVSGNYTDHLTFTMTPQKYVSTDKTLYFNTNAGNDTVIISTDHKFVTLGDKYGVLPTPRRDFYTFEGWYTSATGGTKVTEDTTADAATFSNGSTTLYAHWKAHTLTILYHNDGADKIEWNPDPKDSTPNRAYNNDYTYSDGYITGIKNVDVTLYQVETYGNGFSNGKNGLFNVSRWKRTGYGYESGTASNGTSGYFWWIGKDRTAMCGDGDNCIDNVSTTDCAKKLGVLEDYKEGDVTVDLYPVWTKNGQIVTESDEDLSDDGPVVILPDEDEADSTSTADSETDKTTGKDETAGTDDATGHDDPADTDTAQGNPESDAEEPENPKNDPEETPDDADFPQDEEEEPAADSDTVEEPEEEELTGAADPAEEPEEEPEEEEAADPMEEDDLLMVDPATDFLLDGTGRGLNA